jgi:phosphohistidine swiveling domain-containing protein
MNAAQRDSTTANISPPTKSALAGALVAASWDSDLMPAMHGAGRVVQEEQTINVLIGDFAK